MKITPHIKRAVLAASFAITLVVLIAFIAVATPMRYRTGPWQRVPALDHRLLPHLSAIFAAAFGAFFGSLSAFYLGRVQQRADRREKRHAGLIAAQYALISQWNIVEAIRVQHLEQFRADPNRFVKLGLFHLNVSPELVPFSDLTFVLEAKNPNILHEIHIAQQSYQACIDALSLRNQQLEQFYRNPRVKHQLVNFETGAGITEATPQDLFFLKQATNALYGCVDKALPRLVEAVQQLEKVIKSFFPGMQALKMTPDTQLKQQGTAGTPF